MNDTLTAQADMIRGAWGGAIHQPRGGGVVGIEVPPFLLRFRPQAARPSYLRAARPVVPVVRCRELPARRRVPHPAAGDDGEPEAVPA